MTPAYVCKLLDMLLYHPFKNVVFWKEEVALGVLELCLKDATARFAESDTHGLFDNPVEYILCFNTYCVDMAWNDHGLTEADYHHMIDEFNLSQNQTLKPLYAKLAQALKK